MLLSVRLLEITLQSATTHTTHFKILQTKTRGVFHKDFVCHHASGAILLSVFWRNDEVSRFLVTTVLTQ